MFQVINPYNKETVVEYAFSDDKTVDHTIDQLYQNRSVAHHISIYERAETLNKLALLLEGHKEPLTRLIVKETGKTITDARVELARAKATAEATSAEIRTLRGETLSSDAYPPKRNRLGIVNWYPLGVVYCITPFNFPINIAIHKIAPAYAAGNTTWFQVISAIN
jgi:acyl-CoA reductase-like NAD-dependent aldehyde dehydrogenase